MDALIKATIDSLLEGDCNLSRLKAFLSDLPSQQTFTAIDTKIIEEHHELIVLLLQWLKDPSPGLTSPVSDEAAATVPTSDLSDDDAMALLAEMESPSESAPPASDLSDDDAMALLAEMESPAEAAAPAPQESSMPPEAASAKAASEEIEEWVANEFQADPDMMNDFIQNTDELMTALNESILNLEKDPTRQETIEEIFRAAHTLKGASGMFGFRALERVMHRMENLFDNIRKKTQQATPEITDLILNGMDTITRLLEAVKDGKPCGIKTAHVVDALGAAASGASIPTLAKQPVTGATKADDAPPKEASKTAATSESSTIRVDLHRLDSLVNLVGELVVDRGRFFHIEQQLRKRLPQLDLTHSLTDTNQHFSRHMSETSAWSLLAMPSINFLALYAISQEASTSRLNSSLKGQRLS